MSPDVLSDNDHWGLRFSKWEEDCYANRLMWAEDLAKPTIAVSPARVLLPLVVNSF